MPTVLMTDTGWCSIWLKVETTMNLAPSSCPSPRGGEGDRRAFEGDPQTLGTYQRPFLVREKDFLNDGQTYLDHRKSLACRQAAFCG